MRRGDRFWLILLKKSVFAFGPEKSEPWAGEEN